MGCKHKPRPHIRYGSLDLVHPSHSVVDQISRNLCIELLHFMANHEAGSQGRQDATNVFTSERPGGGRLSISDSSAPVGMPFWPTVIYALKGMGIPSRNLTLRPELNFFNLFGGITDIYGSDKTREV